MQNKNKFAIYNDGVVRIYRPKKRCNDFSAKRNVETVNDMDFIVKLDFAEMSKREQDLIFAEQNSFTLSLKIKTRFVKGVDNKCKVIIDNYLYDISHLDKSKTEMFLYLTGEKEIDT